jgi:tRNA(fMet)-specific endonuclease VapC
VTGSYVLDSDVASPFLSGVSHIVELVSGLDFYLSIIVLGELRFGYTKGSKSIENNARLDRFEAECRLLKVDTVTARIYGELKAEQARRGLPIPKNDMWIAAQARQHGLTVVAYDRHYGFIAGLPVLRPQRL